jgi:hypothetical protein
MAVRRLQRNALRSTLDEQEISMYKIDGSDAVRRATGSVIAVDGMTCEVNNNTNFTVFHCSV